MVSDVATLTGPFDWTSFKLRLAGLPTDPLGLYLHADGNIGELDPTATVVIGLYGCMGAWVFGRMGVWVYGRMGVWMYGCVGVWLHVAPPILH